MISTKPRVLPLDESEWSDEQRELLTRGNSRRVLNVSRTIARHPNLYRNWAPFARHILFESTLDPRLRELVILRTGYLCKASYEVHHHQTLAKLIGLNDAEIVRIQVEPGAPSWTPLERALLEATDELHKQARISDETWEKLAEHFDTKQMLDIIFTVGQYTMVSMALTSLGVQIESE
jgi:alkylhydroperoxidase family enzyme